MLRPRIHGNAERSRRPERDGGDILGPHIQDSAWDYFPAGFFFCVRILKEVRPEVFAADDESVDTKSHELPHQSIICRQAHVGHAGARVGAECYNVLWPSYVSVCAFL